MNISRKAKSKVFRPVHNVLSGLLLKISNPFRKGDFIEINGQLGSVSKRGINKTIITNLDGTHTVIENGKFYQGNLHNLSTQNIIRLAFQINLGYHTDMSRAKEAIQNFLTAEDRILQTPAPKLQVVKLNPCFVELSVQPWCLLDHYMELDHQLELQLKQHLVGLGFEVKADESPYENLGVTA